MLDPAAGRAEQILAAFGTARWVAPRAPTPRLSG
jgi:hypothetical protein